jgi:hypothetical protein
MAWEKKELKAKKKGEDERYVRYQHTSRRATARIVFSSSHARYLLQ